MVEFPDLQFQHSAAEILNSIADYACNGKRVVGPYHMTGQPSSYSAESTTFLQFSLDVYDSAAADVDMSHFPFDNTHANMVIIYPGTIESMTQQNTLFGTPITLYGFSGVDKSLYYTFISEQAVFGGDEHNGTTWDAGYAIWIAVLHHTQYAATAELFHGGGASLIERASYGCATIDTLTAAADSIELKVMTGHNDRGYYIRLSDDEFLLLEAHAMRQGSNAVANDGMYIFHGSDSIYTYVSSDYSSIYRREYVPFGAHSYPDTVFYWIDSVDNDWHFPYRGGNNFTPQSYKKPTLFNDSVADVWITNIRWKNDSVMLFDFNSDKPHEEILSNTGSDIRGLGEMLLQANIISRTGIIATKGVVYSLTEAGCNLEQGLVVYDTSSSATAIAVHLSGLENGTTYYYRAFASTGTHTSLSVVKQFKMNKHAALRQAYYDEQSGKFLLDLELSDDVSHCYYREYMDEMSLIFGTSMFHYSYGNMYNEWDVIDTTGTILESCDIDSTTNLASFGLWIFTAAGDTLTDMFSFNPADIDTIQVHIHDEDIESCKVVKDEIKLVGIVSWSNQQSGRYWVGVAPKSAVYSAFTYYTDDIICNEYDSICDTAFQFSYHLNSSFVNHLLTNYTFTEVDSTGRVSLPQLPPDSDSTIVLVSIDQYGAAQASEWNTKVGMKDDQAIGAPHLGYEDFDGNPQDYGYYQTVFTTDSTLQVEIQPNEFANHYYMLEGTASELAALGVTDTATAVAYRLAHQAEMQRHNCPWLYTGWWDNPSSIIFTKVIDHIHTRTGILPNSNYHVYLFPFNAAGTPGKVERLVFEVKDKFVDVTPAGNGDTAW